MLFVLTTVVAVLIVCGLGLTDGSVKTLSNASRGDSLFSSASWMPTVTVLSVISLGN